jgi:hypothetical protein
VKVAIPHCRGTWFPITATRLKSKALDLDCNNAAGFSSSTGLRITVSRANGPLNDALSCDDIHISLVVATGREVLIQALGVFAAFFKSPNSAFIRCMCRRHSLSAVDETP